MKEIVFLACTFYVYIDFCIKTPYKSLHLFYNVILCMIFFGLVFNLQMHSVLGLMCKYEVFLGIR